MNKLKAFQIKSIKHLENSILKILKISLNETSQLLNLFLYHKQRDKQDLANFVKLKVHAFPGNDSLYEHWFRSSIRRFSLKLK